MVKIKKKILYFLVKILLRLLFLRNVVGYVNIYNTDVISFIIVCNQ